MPVYLPNFNGILTQVRIWGQDSFLSRHPMYIYVSCRSQNEDKLREVQYRKKVE